MTKTKLTETAENVGILLLTAVLGFGAFTALKVLMETIMQLS